MLVGDYLGAIRLAMQSTNRVLCLYLAVIDIHIWQLKAAKQLARRRGTNSRLQMPLMEAAELLGFATEYSAGLLPMEPLPNQVRVNDFIARRKLGGQVSSTDTVAHIDLILRRSTCFKTCCRVEVLEVQPCTHLILQYTTTMQTTHIVNKL